MIRVFLILLLALALISCATPTPAMNNPTEVAEQEYARMFDAALLELREYGFHVDRHDYRFGVITAKPLGSPTVIEPWKPGHSNFDQAAQSTMQQERRQVTIRFEPPTAPATSYLMHAEVMIEHLAVPITRLNGSTNGPHMIDRLSRVPTEWQSQGITSAYWYPVERDTPMEQRLLAAIIRRSFHLLAQAQAQASAAQP